MLASAIALATLVTTAIPVAQAQSEQPPATPIPLDPGPIEAPKVEPTEAPLVTTEAASPQSTDVILWTPATGALQINNAGQTTVRVSSNEGNLDPGSARFQLVINGVFQPIQVASAAAVGSNATLDLTASGLGSVNAAVTQILFKVNRAGGGGAAPDSALYSLTRSSRINVPLSNNNSGASTIPRVITQTGANSCDAFINRRGSPLGSYVNYLVNGTAGQSWFWTVNPAVNATLVVSLTNYTSVAGQLQVFSDINGVCSNLTPLLAFGANPNPVVAVANAPTGNIYFRVVSANSVTAPPPYNISWGYARGGTPTTGFEIEPNNNTCQGTPIPSGAIFGANDNDQFDFFSLTITQSGQILILMDNQATAGTQVQVRAPVGYNGFPEANCQPTMPQQLRKDPYVEPIGTVSSPGAQVLSRAGGLVFPGGADGDTAGTLATPQTWFMRVATPNQTGQSGQQYSIRWVFLPPGVSPYPFPDKMTQTGPARGSDPLLRAGDPYPTTAREKWYYSFFWANMDKNPAGAADTIQFGIDSFQLDGCPNAQFPPDPGRTVPNGFAGNWVTVSNQSSGVMTWKFNKSGAYKIRFRALRNGAVVNSDEKPLRVDCGFPTYNYGGLWPFSTDNIATPGSPLIGPEKPVNWVDPIP